MQVLANYCAKHRSQIYDVFSGFLGLSLSASFSQTHSLPPSHALSLFLTSPAMIHFYNSLCLVCFYPGVSFELGYNLAFTGCVCFYLSSFLTLSSHFNSKTRFNQFGWTPGNFKSSYSNPDLFFFSPLKSFRTKKHLVFI